MAISNGESGSSVRTKLNASLAKTDLITVTGAVNLDTMVSLTDGDKGDITVSSSGTVWTIDDGAVGFAKLVNVSTNTFLGRSTSGVGDVEELSVSAARSILNVESGADVTDEANVVAALSGATLTDIGAPAAADRVLVQDASDGNNLKYADFSDFASAGTSWSDPVNADIVPDADGTRDLGATATRFGESYVDVSYVTNGIVLTEAADHPIAPSAGIGQLWVSNDATQVLYFTDDSGTDRTVLDSASGDVLTAVAPALSDPIGFFDASDSNRARQATINQVLKLKKEHIIIAVSDETTALTTGAGKVTFRMPYAFTVSEVRASVTTAPTTSGITVDINEGGGTILSTKLTIDATEKTSTTAATPAVISDPTLADDAEITIDIDAIGSGTAGAGLKVTLIGTQT